MKKIFSIFIIVCLIGSAVYADTVDDPSIVHLIDRNSAETYINGEVRTDIKDIQYVGNGYLVKKENDSGDFEQCFTEDFENYKSVNLFNDRESYDLSSRAGYMDEIKWADGVYLARSNVYDNTSKSGRCLEKEGWLYILDSDFQFVKKIKFDWYVRAMSYINGIYYVKISNKTFLRENVWSATADDVVEKVYSSSDLENWAERSELENVPICNGTNTITLKDLNIYTFENDGIGDRIVYEDVNIPKVDLAYANTENQQILNLVGEYYWVANNNLREDPGCKFWVSNDGIYMTGFNIAFPELNAADTLRYSWDKNYILKSDIDKYLPQNSVYVKLNSNILGFSQPPVMENDRTLVPMRFLFEQMGAEVDWNDAVQTAVAKISTRDGGENTVTFSIDNTTAYVNGAETTMDVPARLINDQTFVPLRFLSENLGYTVEWDESNNTAIITTE